MIELLVILFLSWLFGFGIINGFLFWLAILAVTYLWTIQQTLERNGRR